MACLTESDLACIDYATRLSIPIGGFSSDEDDARRALSRVPVPL